MSSMDSAPSAPPAAGTPSAPSPPASHGGAVIRHPGPSLASTFLNFLSTAALMACVAIAYFRMRVLEDRVEWLERNRQVAQGAGACRLPPRPDPVHSSAAHPSAPSRDVDNGYVAYSAAALRRVPEDADEDDVEGEDAGGPAAYAFDDGPRRPPTPPAATVDARGVAIEAKEEEEDLADVDEAAADMEDDEEEAPP